MLPIEPFTKWGIDFICPIKPIGCYTNNCYVLVVIDYTIKWVKANTLWTNTILVIARILCEFILTQFGYPLTLLAIKVCILSMTPSKPWLCTFCLNIQVPLPTTHKRIARPSQLTKSLAYSSPNWWMRSVMIRTKTCT